MELRVLRYFLAVAREQSISGAAQSLHITQPTLSRQMMELEEELGTKLLVRGKKNRRVELTEDGLLLRSRAEEIVDLANKTEAEFSREEHTVTGDIFIGAGETDAMRILAAAAKRLHQSYPNIRYHLFSGNAEAVTERLDKGLLDFGILIGEADLTKYNALTLPASETWGVLMRRDSELASNESIRPEMLWDKPLIMSQQSVAHNEFTGWLGLEPERLNVIATYNLIYNASLLVEEGLGYAITIENLVNTSDSPLAFRPFEPRLEGRLSLVWKKYHAFSRAAELFIRELREKI